MGKADPMLLKLVAMDFARLFFKAAWSVLMVFNVLCDQCVFSSPEQILPSSGLVKSCLMA